VSSPRSACLIAIIVVMTYLFPGPGQAASREAADRRSGVVAASGESAEQAGTAGRDPVKDLADLRKQAEEAAKALAAATKALEDRRAKLKEADRELSKKLRELENADRALEEVRKPLADLALLLYQQAAAGDVAMFIMTGQADENTLRALGDITQIAQQRDTIAAETGRLLEQRERLAIEAQNLRAEKLLSEAQIDVEVDTLRKRSDKIVKSLTQALAKLGIKVDKVGRAAFSCDPTKAKAAARFPNGLIPDEYLCPLQQKGHKLRADAAIAFISLNEAYRKRFGTPICVSDSYRSLAAQQSVYYRRPGFAAVPGRSNHGLGLAVDLCGGVERFRSPQFNWMEQNGKKYGWIHPDWAYSNPFEPWHWEYDPKIGSLL